MTTATRSRVATDSGLEPEERLIIAVFNRARIDLFARSDRLRYEVERFLEAHGFDAEGVRRCWQKSRN